MHICVFVCMWVGGYVRGGGWGGDSGEGIGGGGSRRTGSYIRVLEMFSFHAVSQAWCWCVTTLQRLSWDPSCCRLLASFSLADRANDKAFQEVASQVQYVQLRWHSTTWERHLRPLQWKVASFVLYLTLHLGIFLHPTLRSVDVKSRQIHGSCTSSSKPNYGGVSYMRFAVQASLATSLTCCRRSATVSTASVQASCTFELLSRSEDNK